MSETKETIEERYEGIEHTLRKFDGDLYNDAADLLDDLMAEREKMKEALEANMRWIGPPPTSPTYYDSLREDAWALRERLRESETDKESADAFLAVVAQKNRERGY